MNLIYIGYTYSYNIIYVKKYPKALITLEQGYFNQKLLYTDNNIYT